MRRELRRRASSAEQILHGGRILAFDPALQGDALLVRDGRIAARDRLDRLRNLAPRAECIDLAGALLLPGLTDTHTHFYEFARRLDGIDLSLARSFAELERCLQAAARAIEPGDSWLGGSGWDPRGYGQLERIDRHLLDEIFGDRPVALEARDFHTLWCNSAALRAAGLLGRPNGSVELPPGASIGRLSDGSPSGLLFESAWDLIWRARPVEDDRTAELWIARATSRAHELGLTGVHCMEPESTLTHYRRLAERGQLQLRLCLHTPLAELDERIERGVPSYRVRDPWLVEGGVKIFVDGSLGSRSAWMSRPYPDGSHGRILCEPQQLREDLLRAARAGIAGSIHAIGDAAVELVADVYLELSRRLPRPPSLPRVEHAQCVRPEIVDRLAAARVYCAVQPVHLLDDLDLLEEEWQEAAAWAYPLRSLRKAGVLLGFGSDAPVAPLDPRPGIVAAVSRAAPATTGSGDPGPGARAHGFQPQETLSVLEALRAYTLDAAAGSGRSNDLGSISVGKWADLTAVDDVLDERVESWLGARTRLVMVAGEIVHEAL